MKKLIFYLTTGILLSNLGLAQCPSPSFTSTAPSCSANSVSFTNTTPLIGGGWTFFWDFDYPNGGGSSPSTSTNQNPTGINYSGGGNGVYTVALTVSNASMGCSSTVLMDIDIRTVRADFVLPNNAFCVNDSIHVANIGTGSSSPTATVTHQWSFGAGASPSTSNLATPPDITYTSSGAKTITHVVQVNYGGCGGIRTDVFTQNINVNPIPTPSFTTVTAACISQNVDFNYSGSPVVNYNWDFGSQATPITSNAISPTNILYSTSGQKIVNLQVTNSYGCHSTFVDTIVVYSKPMVNAGNDTVICANTSAVIGSNNDPNLSYSWISSNPISSNVVSNPTASPNSPYSSYYLEVTDLTTGCKNQDTVSIEMLAPLIANAGIDYQICYGDSIQIGSGAIQGQNYSWNNSSVLSNQIASNPIAKPLSTTTFLLSVTGYGCGPETDEVTVVVKPLPMANAGPNDSITLGQTIQLQATGGIQYEWLNTYALSNSGIPNPIASPDTTTTYVVLVTDVYGCRNTDTVTILVKHPDYWYPNTFSPNQDGNNDVFFVRGIGFKSFEIAIYNSLGEQIYFSKDVTQGWDGTHQLTAQPLPESAYVFNIKCVLSDSTEVNENGLINLIR